MRYGPALAVSVVPKGGAGVTVVALIPIMIMTIITIIITATIIMTMIIIVRKMINTYHI